VKIKALVGIVIVATMPFASHAAFASDVISSSPSPDGRMTASWTKKHEVVLTDASGATLQKIGIHGAAPLFSHDGSLIAYEKLADESPDGDDQSLFELAQGIAVYDLRTGQERLVTNGGSDDFAPVGFSKDLSLLYFNSTRPYEESPWNHVASIWVVDLKSGRTQRLTNLSEDAVMRGDMIPTISPKAIWSSDRTVAITSYGPEKGVWKFVLTANEISAFRIADGDSPEWAVQDRTFVTRVVSNGKTSWNKINLR